MSTLTSVKSGLCWYNVKCWLVNEELITNIVSYFSNYPRGRLLVKKDWVASTRHSARNESVNHLYNVRFICTLPMLFALRVITYLFTYLLTYSMEQSPSWEANRFSASQEILRVLWNPKVYYRSQKCPPPVLILSQLDHTKVSVQVWGLPFVSQHDTFLRWGVVSTSPNPQTGGPPLVGCPRLLIQYIRSYPPYWRPFLHPQPEDAPWRGDRDPLITSCQRKDSYVLTCCASCVLEFYSRFSKQ